MPIQITSPHRFKERICVFGAEGTGKSSAILNILKYDLTAHAWIVDIDYSFAYERLIASEYPEVEGRVHVFSIDPDWDQMRAVLATIAEQADQERDWLVIDPTTATWQMVQSWFSDRVHGEDISDHLIQIRADNQAARNAVKGKSAKDQEDAKKGYSRDIAEDMTWPLINKVYQQQFYSALHKWRGHFILVCESDAVRKDASDEERATYGFIGNKPKGQKSLPYVAASNIFLAHPTRDKWTLTSVKDRGRVLVERVALDEFALDYLVDIGGWEKSVVKSAAGTESAKGGGAG